MGSVETVKAFATKPRETISGIPEGVGRWYKKTKFKVQETYVDVQEERQEHAEADAEQKSEQRDELQGEAKDLAHKEALDYLKISGAERRWYAELGVDPFTDNQVLREVVREYSRVEGLTSFGMKFAGLPGIPGAREVRKAMALVWQTDPWELRLQNRKKLLAAGITEATARRFEDNPNLTLTQQTGLLLSLDELKGVAGRQSVLARAIEVDSKAGGQMLTHSLGLMASIHREQKLAAVLEGTALPVARLAAGGLVAVLPADAVFWTEPIAAAAAEFAAAYRPEGAPARELRVLGQVTERATRELGELGWRVVERWRPAERDEPSPAG
jgi:hypothetical protein